MAMLEVKDLEVYYGMIQAIKGISFEVNQGVTAINIQGKYLDYVIQTGKKI